MALSYFPQWRFLSFFLLLILSGCQAKVQLMPTPALLSQGGHDFFAANPALVQSTEVQVPYATNRIPIGKGDVLAYTIFGNSDLRFGVADLKIGEEKSWEQVHAISTGEKSGERPILRLEDLSELARAEPEQDPETGELLEFFTDINKELAKKLDKDLIIYVHGANSSVYRATAQAAQFHHFTGRNSLVLAFLWPSAENLFRYGTDVRHAALTAPVFSHFLKLLSRYTEARKIHILAYSAAAQVVSPALSLLARELTEQHTAPEEPLRLGTLYLAAPDLDIPVFIDQLPGYITLFDRITISLNTRDRVLSYAESHHRTPRLGLPRGNEVPHSELGWLREATEHGNLTLLVVDSSYMPMNNPTSHSFWYSHPWVSSDILLQLWFNTGPVERGLERHETDSGLFYWLFPEDYPQQISLIFNTILESILDSDQPDQMK